ncbi:hypothetical protein [Hymenobacter tenuis]
MRATSHPRLYSVELAEMSRERKKQIARGRIRFVLLVLLGGLCFLAYGCMAYGPKSNRKPTSLGIKDAERPATRLSYRPL